MLITDKGLLSFIRGYFKFDSEKSVQFFTDNFLNLDSLFNIVNLEPVGHNSCYIDDLEKLMEHNCPEHLGLIDYIKTKKGYEQEEKNS